MRNSLRRHAYVALSAAACAAACGFCGAATQARSATEVYRAALASMQSVREPAFLTYRTVVPPGDTTLVVSRDELGRAELSVSNAPSQGQTWNVAYRESDGTAAMTLDDGSRVISHLAIFDPTWRGAFTWMRHGLGADVVPPSTPSPGTSPPSNAPVSLPVLAIVTAINENNYDVSEGGGASCGDGRMGHQVWTKAKVDPETHPLAGAVIDEGSMRFCAMEFREHLPSPTVTLDLDIQLHFSQVGAFYLITDGTVTGAVRPYKRPGWFTMHTAFKYDRLAFPSSLPDALFTLPGSS